MMIDTAQDTSIIPASQKPLVEEVIRLSLRELLLGWPGHYADKLPREAITQWQQLDSATSAGFPEKLTVPQTWAAINAIQTTILFLGPEEMHTITGRSLGQFLNAARVLFNSVTGLNSDRFWEDQPC
jgi:hypothetical protein